jgi:hypothetical protein
MLKCLVSITVHTHESGKVCDILHVMKRNFTNFLIYDIWNDLLLKKIYKFTHKEFCQGEAANGKHAYADGKSFG